MYSTPATTTTPIFIPQSPTLTASKPTSTTTQVPTFTTSPTPTHTGTNGGYSTSDKIALGVGIPAAIAAGVYLLVQCSKYNLEPLFLNIIANAL
jgi:hypothetical protein